MAQFYPLFGGFRSADRADALVTVCVGAPTPPIAGIRRWWREHVVNILFRWPANRMPVTVREFDLVRDGMTRG